MVRSLKYFTEFFMRQSKILQPDFSIKSLRLSGTSGYTEETKHYLQFLLDKQKNLLLVEDDEERANMLRAKSIILGKEISKIREIKARENRMMPQAPKKKSKRGYNIPHKISGKKDILGNYSELNGRACYSDRSGINRFVDNHQDVNIYLVEVENEKKEHLKRERHKNDINLERLLGKRPWND